MLLLRYPKSNANTTRYRLTKEDILTCCKSGYTLGFRTFVLQGGEDGYFTDSRLCDIVSSIKSSYPDCAITLSVGENLTRAIRHYLKLVQTVIFCAMRHLTPCITKTASVFSDCRKSSAMPLAFKRNRISGRYRIYGRFPLSNFRKSCRRSVIY